jgi:hypothetical protein
VGTTAALVRLRPGDVAKAYLDALQWMRDCLSRIGS